MKRYDPEHAPDPEEWLELSEAARIRLAREYHLRKRVKLPSLQAHASMHVIVENQIAGDFEPSSRAVIRLQNEGLSRHDAIHAIGSAVAECIFEATKMLPNSEPEVLQTQLAAAIERLSAVQWIKDYGA